MAQKYTVLTGDNLSKIAKKFYGDAARFTLITEANNNPQAVSDLSGSGPDHSRPTGIGSAAPATPPEVLR
jgi:nucleoid-associated protein YgaU